MSYQNIEVRADKLLAKRGISGHTAADRFVSDFKAYLIYFDATGKGSADATLTLLEDDSNLTDSKILSNNFRTTLDNLVSPKLRADPIFLALFDVLLSNKGKGIGEGELALPLILSGYSFSNVSDGRLTDGSKVEIKKNGASLKPVPTGLTEKGLVDQLNKKYWNGTVPGKKEKKLFESHIKAVKDPKDYSKYFAELYIGCDTKSLAEEVIRVYNDKDKFCRAVGKFALKEYKRVDGWHNIIYIDADTRQVVNIADVDDIDKLNIKFSPVLRRGKDTQAIADGYVNISI